VPNALEVLEEVKDTDLGYIGCKDIGLNLDQYMELFDNIKKYGMTSFLEVVTYDEEEYFRGVNLALTIGADYLIGGMPQYTEKTLEFLETKGSEIKYFPYIGNVVSHPCILEGSLEEIIQNGNEAESLGVDGVNLLLYRYTGEQKELLNKTVEKLNVPVIVAGSIKTFEQIEELKRKNVWAFTIGSAIFEKQFSKEKSIKDQISTVLSKLKN
jgi:NAD(P)H-dependent flavin oxidoreductase YrpB (nitropropane dioxygenase family)